MAIDDAALASLAFAFQVFSMALYWPLPLICLTTNDDEYSANDSVSHCSSREASSRRGPSTGARSRARSGG